MDEILENYMGMFEMYFTCKFKDKWVKIRFKKSDTLIITVLIIKHSCVHAHLIITDFSIHPTTE